MARPTARAGAVLAALALLATTACSPAGGGGNAQDEPQKSAKGRQTIEFWTINLKTNFNDYIQGLIDDYEAKNSNITIKWVDVPGADMSSRLLTAIASGDVPDAVNLASSDLDQFVPALADLSKSLDKDALAGYQPNLIDPLERDGRLVGLPWYNAGPPISLYNNAILKKAGLDPKTDLPTTWDEAITFGRKVHSATGVYGHNQFLYPQIFMSEGIDLLSDDRKSAAFNTPEAEAFLQKWVDAYGTAIAPGVISKDAAQLPQTMENGQIAFQPTSGPFVLNNIESNAPKVFKDLTIAPAVTGPSGKHFLAAQNALIVPAKSDSQQAAADFIAYVSNAKNQLEFCKLVAIFPSTAETLEDPFFANPSGDTPQDQARQIGVESFDQLTDGALGTGRDKELFDALDEQVRLALTGKKDPAKALADAAAAWAPILAEIQESN